TGQCAAGLRSDQAIDRTAIIALVAQSDLHVLDHLARREIVVAVDWFVIGVGAIDRAVAVSRIPVTAPPVVITAAEQNETRVRKTIYPPNAVVPDRYDAGLRG